MASVNDWLGVADPKLLAEAIAERFRLSQNELEKAQEALAPAFALGLQRAMESPAAWSDLSRAFSAMVPGSLAAAPKAAPGKAFLEIFFGSNALTGAVARQASMMAGIAPDTIQKLMPSLAMMTMDAMVRATIANIGRNQPQGLATGDFGGATAEMMRRGANAVEALSRPSGSPQTQQPVGTDAFSEAVRAGLAWMQPQRPAAGAGTAPGTAPGTTGDPAGVFNPMLPFTAMFDAFSRGMETSRETPRAPEPVPETSDRAAAENDLPKPGAGVVGDMLRSGQQLQEGYAKEMAILFERYQGAKKSA